MQTLKQTGNSNIMPLLINFTMPSPKQKVEEPTFSYNDGEQISYEMRFVGTKSLRVGTTGKPMGMERKNEIDDSKCVK